MRWEDVDFRWWTLTLADKVDQTRTIPLGPYLGQMLATLPRVGPYVFSSASKSGRIADARNSHAKALAAAGIEHLTIHGLRRSFALLGPSLKFKATNPAPPLRATSPARWTSFART